MVEIGWILFRQSRMWVAYLGFLTRLTQQVSLCIVNGSFGKRGSQVHADHAVFLHHVSPRSRFAGALRLLHKAGCSNIDRVSSPLPGILVETDEILRRNIFLHVIARRKNVSASGREGP